MHDVAIRAENLGKQFRIGETENYYRFSELLTGLVTKPLRGLRRLVRSGQKPPVDGPEPHRAKTFWALQDISFDVKKGDVVGIIGRNGAGKSTLLKILARITDPTTGRAEIHGRVGSLLEVGTGFHPELTGRENIFLNGAILGMSRAEIHRKFDEIIAFAEVDQFLDTPVKRYSSGMYMRLAFAVAAHSEPEILIVDEVLAVGDAAFQKKCLGRMGEVARGGRTVLFVSHNMAAMTNLCNSAILLDAGRIQKIGDPQDVVKTYLSQSEAVPRTDLSQRTDRRGSGALRFTAIDLRDESGAPVSSFCSGMNPSLVLHYENRTGGNLNNVSVALGISDAYGTRIAHLSNSVCDAPFQNIPPGEGAIEVSIDRLPLMSGRYSVTLFCTANGPIVDWVTDAAFFDVCDGDFYGTGKLLPDGQGIFLIDHSFALIDKAA